MVSEKRLEMLLAFCLFFKPENFRSNQDNVFGATGDMNVLAVPSGLMPPPDLPEIKSAGEYWQNVYAQFYARNKIAMP